MLPEEEREKLLQNLTEEEANELLYDWKFWARPKQLPPGGDWYVWLILAGRGFGKTRTGAELVRMWQEQGYNRFALIGQTPGEVRDVMIEGESGILAISTPWNMPVYEPSKRKLTWPNGAYALTFSGENPEQLRGPQHEKAWVDELAKLKYPQETWDNLEFGLRLGNNPQVAVTTTPKPIKLVRELLKDKQTHVTSGSSYENIGNLAPAFIQRIISKYEGTRLGRQELYAEVLEDVEGALWKSKQLEDLRVTEHPELKRIVVGVDPAVTNEEGSDETGIIVAGVDVAGHGYILGDESLKDSPDRWARAAVTAYNKNSADRIIGEANNGGDLIEIVIRTVDNKVSYKKVHASRGKLTRAEPIAALYEQGKVHHVGLFPNLEDEMCSWVPGMKSPNRLDALVWALTELMLDSAPEPRVRSF